MPWMRAVLLFLTTLGVSGCFAAGSLYRQPGTQETRVCAQHGFGSLGVPLAIWRYTQCKDRLAASGYVKDRTLTVHEVACLGRRPNADGTCSDETIRN
jgi:hypothetical protein